MKNNTIACKKDLVDAVRRLNPAGCSAQPKIFWDVEGKLRTTTIDGGNVSQQLVIVENGVNAAARRYNTLKTICDKKTKDLKEKLDEMEAVKSETEHLKAMAEATEEAGARIQFLNEEADEVLFDICQRMHQTRALERMLFRLKKNQIKFDAHLNGMEETVNGVREEAADLFFLRKDLDAGLAKAVFALDETKTEYQTAAKDREVLRSQRTNELETAHRLQNWLNEREMQKQALATELRGDLTKEEEMVLRTQVLDKEERSRRLQKANEDSRITLHEMEEWFMEVKQVTGGSSLEAIIEKFAAQQKNKKELEKEVGELRKSLIKVKRQYVLHEETFAGLKSAAAGRIDFNRESVYVMDDTVNSLKNELKVYKSGNTRLERVLVSLKQGSNMLSQRCIPHIDVIDVNSFELSRSDDEFPAADTMQALSTAESILSRMLELLAAGDLPRSPSVTGQGLEDFEPIDDDHSVDTQQEIPSDKYNVRIRSKKKMLELEEKVPAAEPPIYSFTHNY
jgi:chromosome segregation ATPase